MDNAIVEIIQGDTPEAPVTGKGLDEQGDETPTQATATKSVVKSVVNPDSNTAGNSGTKDHTGDANNKEPTVKGTLKTKTYALKKKTDSKRRSFKCSECDTVKKSIKELNIHHEESHNPQICGVCGKLFKHASSLARHMYEHNQPRYKCDQCDFSCQFESELNTHKIVH